jgi:hypothetical protein
MHRRTLLQRLTGLFGTLSFVRTGSFAQAGVFTQKQRLALIDLASIVLPSALGKSGFEEAAMRFDRYVREYHAGADTDHGYGFTHVVRKPSSPFAAYADQLSSLPMPVTRIAVEQALEKSQIKELPRTPEGKSVIADLMSFYFRSSEANDLCYRAEIGRDACRGLAGSERAPSPLRRSG